MSSHGYEDYMTVPYKVILAQLPDEKFGPWNRTNNFTQSCLPKKDPGSDSQKAFRPNFTRVCKHVCNFSTVMPTVLCNFYINFTQEILFFFSCFCIKTKLQSSTNRNYLKCVGFDDAISSLLLTSEKVLLN